MQRITPSLWFDGNAEEAVNFYISVFKNSKIVDVLRYGKGAPFPEGTVLTISFVLDGMEFSAINGGPEFPFTEAISLAVTCASQQEVDDLWAALTAGGAPGPCGWLKDKYGLSWQIVPSLLLELMRDEDPEKANRVTQAMLQMSKIDIATLRQAYAGEQSSNEQGDSQ